MFSNGSVEGMIGILVKLVKETSAKLREASEADQDAEPLKKIADAKLAKDFQAALKDFQKAQRLAAERETAYTSSVPKEALPSSQYSIYTCMCACSMCLPIVCALALVFQLLLKDMKDEIGICYHFYKTVVLHLLLSYDAYEVEKNSSKSLEHQQLVVTKRQEVVLLENEITFNEDIIEEREQGIKEVQQQISEVNEIFKDLAVLVHEQGAMIDDIGSNIENSHAATVQATSHLKRHPRSREQIRQQGVCWC
ncbi:Syntaxin-23 [Hibiscus syriacus]|uniref:Syntaxin-23 n=1 Tax=Hibiscus syriacus TaxID=106335 RepID=A0A6A3CCI6_HIBSY|nr:Syntaxin-23 [Hibiscus syriacus]